MIMQNYSIYSPIGSGSGRYPKLYAACCLQHNRLISEHYPNSETLGTPGFFGLLLRGRHCYEQSHLGTILTFLDIIAAYAVFEAVHPFHVRKRFINR